MQNIFNLLENKRFNILTVTAHERTQSNLSDVNADFYLYKKSPHIKTWNSSFASLPKNFYQLPEEYFPEGIQFDFILSQHKFGCFQELVPIAQRLKLPLITIEHTVPMSWPKDHFDKIKSMRGDVNIFIGPNQAKEWEEENPYIIRHCVDTSIFYPQEKRVNTITCCVNDFINRGDILGFNQYMKVTNGLPVVRIGDTPGFSQAAKSVEDLAQLYRSSRIFINNSIRSPIPTVLLEAMACLPPGEFIFFDYQCEKIEDIIKLKTFNEKTKNDKILIKHTKPYNGSLFKIKANNLPPFRLTENHPVAIVEIIEKYNKELKKQNKRPYNKFISEIKYKECKNLSKNDYLVVPKPIKNEVELPIEDDWLIFYGLFVAEGYTNKGNICLTFNINENNLIDFVCNFTKKYIDRETKVEKLPKENAVRCIFTHAALARKINKYFCGLSHEKRIPDDFMKMNKRQTKIFIDAYLDGDGYRKLNNEDFTYSTTSPYLARQIFYLLMKFDVLPSLSNIKPKNGKIRNKEFIGKPGYQVSFYSNKKNSKKLYLQDDNNFYVKIKDIQETHYIGEVYNLSTESNTFTIPFALTHNCGCAVVSTNNCEIPYYIEHGYNGLLTNSDDQMRMYLEKLLKDEDLANFLGENARKTILEKCSKDEYTKKWDDLFNKLRKSQRNEN